MLLLFLKTILSLKLFNDFTSKKTLYYSEPEFQEGQFNIDANKLNFTEIFLINDDEIDISGKSVSLIAASYISIKLKAKSLAIVEYGGFDHVSITIEGPIAFTSRSRYLKITAIPDTSNKICPYLYLRGDDNSVIFDFPSRGESFETIAAYITGSNPSIKAKSIGTADLITEPTLNKTYRFLGYDSTLFSYSKDTFYVINYSPSLFILILNILGILLIIAGIGGGIFYYFMIYKKNENNEDNSEKKPNDDQNTENDNKSEYI